MCACIYQIINTVNNKIYIGSSTQVKVRWQSHLRDLKKNIHCNLHLQRAFNMYGVSSFRFEIVEKVYDIAFLIETEQYYINNTPLDMLYNMNLEASRPPRPEMGRKLPESVKLKISMTKKANPVVRMLSDEHKKRISEAQSGKSKSKLHRDKIANSLRGRTNQSSLKKWKLIHPCGKIEIFLGLTEPAKLYNLNAHDLNAVAHNRQRTHKGFKCEPYSE